MHNCKSQIIQAISLFSIEAESSSEKAERCRSAPLCTIVAASPFYVKQFTLQMYSGR